MTASDIRQALTSILIESFSVDAAAVIPEATFEDLGLDSLDVVSFVMALEDRLRVEIPETDLQEVETIGDAVALLERKMAVA